MSCGWGVIFSHKTFVNTHLLGVFSLLWLTSGPYQQLVFLFFGIISILIKMMGKD